MTILSTLDKDHQLRNKPLKEIQAEYRNQYSQRWQPVSSWAIKNKTYNDLDPVWTDHEFRAQE